MRSVGVYEHPTPIVRVESEEAWPGEVVPLEPVDSVSITTVCDNCWHDLRADNGIRCLNSGLVTRASERLIPGVR